MRNPKLVILAALEMEARAAARALNIPFNRSGPLKHATGDVEIHIIGMRAERLRQLLDSIDFSPSDRCWLVGLAGALDPTLRVGDLVIDGPAETGADFSTLNTPVRSADPTGSQAGSTADINVRRGRIHTTDRLVATPAEKRTLFAQTGAAAVDMEQQIVRKMLAPLGVAVVGIRAISDTADTPLDPALPHLVDALGRPKWRALAAALIRRPGLVGPLIRLGKDSSRACTQLSRVVAQAGDRQSASEAAS